MMDVSRSCSDAAAGWTAAMQPMWSTLRQLVEINKDQRQKKKKMERITRPLKAAPAAAERGPRSHRDSLQFSF